MGDWGKIAGGFLAGMFGMPLGSPTAMFGGDQIENALSGDAQSQVSSYSGLGDSSAAIAASENQLQATQMLAATMELGILENSKNAQFQTKAWLTERLDTLDNKLQIALVEQKQRITAEANRHVEKMTDYRNRFGSREGHGDLPPPDFES